MTTSPNSPDATLAAAMQLGWHVAELYALVDDTGEPVSDTLLPSHAGLSREDQVELQLRAAAGDALRAGVTSEEASLEALLEAGRAAPSSPEAAEAFRRQLRQCHIEVQKDLWARDALAGKAYELGNGLSDTYGRICCAYRHDDEDERATWMNVFERPRLERLKRLLDDLSSRLNASGVAVVRAQLDTWQREVHTQLEENRLPPVEKVRDGLRRQTIIWCQLLTGDKEPEAYLDRHARSDLRDELRRLIWRRYRRWLIPIGAVLFLFALLLPHLIRLYETGVVQTGLASAVFAVAGALGITKASVVLTLRGRLDQWSQLLWNRAVAQKVSDVTLSVSSVWPPVPAERRLRIPVPEHVSRRLKGSVVARRPSAARS